MHRNRSVSEPPNPGSEGSEKRPVFSKEIESSAETGDFLRSVSGLFLEVVSDDLSRIPSSHFSNIRHVGHDAYQFMTCITESR